MERNVTMEELFGLFFPETIGRSVGKTSMARLDKLTGDHGKKVQPKKKLVLLRFQFPLKQPKIMFLNSILQDIQNKVFSESN